MAQNSLEIRYHFIKELILDEKLDYCPVDTGSDSFMMTLEWENQSRERWQGYLANQPTEWCENLQVDNEGNWATGQPDNMGICYIYQQKKIRWWSCCSKELEGGRGGVLVWTKVNLSLYDSLAAERVLSLNAVDGSRLFSVLINCLWILYFLHKSQLNLEPTLEYIKRQRERDRSS